MIASPLVVRLLVEPLVAVWLVVVVRKLQKKTNITSRKAFLFNLRHRRWMEVTVFTPFCLFVILPNAERFARSVFW